MSYRFESVLWRELRKVNDVGEDSFVLRTIQKQQDAMLELDTILNRILLHSLVSLCPFSM